MYLFFSTVSEEKLCPLRASIDVLEGEYFFLCYLESRQEHFQEEAYTVKWYKENAGKQQLIKETYGIVSQRNSLEFWPAELSDSGNYLVTHRWVHKLVGEHLAFALVYEEADFFLLLCVAHGIHTKEVQGTTLAVVSFSTSFHSKHPGRPIILTNSYRQLQPFKGAVNLSIRQVAFLLLCD